MTGPQKNKRKTCDITEHPTGEGELYLCAVKNIVTRRIVGYSIADRMTSPLAVDAMSYAVTRRGLVRVVHADRGSLFRSQDRGA